MEKKIKLRVQGLTNSQVQSGAYALILAEEGSVQTLTKLTPIQLESRRVQKLKDEEDKGIKAEEEDKNKIDFGELFGI